MSWVYSTNVRTLDSLHKVIKELKLNGFKVKSTKAIACKVVGYNI